MLAGHQGHFAGVIHVLAAEKHHATMFHRWCMKELTVDTIDSAQSSAL